MGTDPQFLTRPRTMAIARAAARGRPDERCTHQAVPRRPRSRTEELASAGAGRHRLAVGFARTRRHRWLTGSSRDMPSSATVASAIARRRERPARGVKAGPVPSQTSCETIATPHAYTGRASRSRRARLRSPVRASMISRFGSQTIALGDGVRSARSTRRSSASARRSRLRRSTSWRARKAYTSLRSGLSPRANVLVERTPADGHADAERQRGSFEPRAELFEDVQDLVGA